MGPIDFKTAALQNGSSSQATENAPAPKLQAASPAPAAKETPAASSPIAQQDTVSLSGTLPLQQTAPTKPVVTWKRPAGDLCIVDSHDHISTWPTHRRRVYDVCFAPGRDTVGTSDSSPSCNRNSRAECRKRNCDVCCANHRGNSIAYRDGDSGRGCHCITD